jgi:hypothetical protein
MELKIALALAQLGSLVVFVCIARWYVAPWLSHEDRCTALVALLWPHVFRYVALQSYSAQHAGFPISDAGLARIVYGDVAGAVLAIVAILALRHKLRAGIAMSWLLVLMTIADTVSNVAGGIRENLFGAATGVTWMVVAFYVPFLMVTLALTAWQLISRHGESITDEPALRTVRARQASAI